MIAVASITACATSNPASQLAASNGAVIVLTVRSLPVRRSGLSTILTIPISSDGIRSTISGSVASTCVLDASTSPIQGGRHAVQLATNS